MNENMLTVTVGEATGIIRDYFTHRGFTTPSKWEAFLFLTSETGEIADALVSEGETPWVRSNPDREREVEKEIADVMMMLLVLADVSGVDPVKALVENMMLKGFDCGETLQKLRSQVSSNDPAFNAMS